MRTLFTTRIVIAAAALLAGIMIVVFFGAQRGRGPGQQPLADIKDMATLRTQFNLDTGKTRLIILGSPT